MRRKIMDTDKRIINIESLNIPAPMKKEVRRFCEEILRSCEGKIISVTAMGSAATSDFLNGVSDVNILVVFSQLDLSDLTPVAPKAFAWWRRFKLTPLFISKSNLMYWIVL